MSFLTPALSSTLSFFIWPHLGTWTLSLVSNNKKYHDADYGPDDEILQPFFTCQDCPVRYGTYTFLALRT